MAASSGAQAGPAPPQRFSEAAHHRPHHHGGSFHLHLPHLGSFKSAIASLQASHASRVDSAAAYLVVRPRIGAGAHSTVDLVQRIVDDRLLVLKRFPQSSQTAMREAQLLTALRHPSVITVHDFFVNKTPGGGVNIIMDYCSSGDLQRHLDERRSKEQHVTDAEAFHLCSQLLSALAHCHRHRVLHRDVKPANCFLARIDGASPHGPDDASSSTTHSAAAPSAAAPSADGGGGNSSAAAAPLLSQKLMLGDFSVSRSLTAGGGLASTISGEVT